MLPNDGTWGGIPFREVDREARKVTAAFGLHNASVQNLSTSENRVWRVVADGTIYVLRCHRPPSLDQLSLPALQPAAIAEELEWLQILQPHLSFPIPQPKLSLDGSGVVSRAMSMEVQFHWTMLTWIHGRSYRRGLRDRHMEWIGRSAAELHAAVRKIGKLPSHRPHWGKQRLDLAIESLRPFYHSGQLPGETWEVCLEGQRRCSAVMAAPTGQHNTGFIHADLGVQNILFHQRTALPIDFCSSGTGWFAFDLAQVASLAPAQHYWDSCVRGYFAHGGTGVPEADIRAFAGLTFILWLNAHTPTAFVAIQARLPKVTQRVKELLD